MNAITMKTLCMCMAVAVIGNVSGQNISTKPITDKTEHPGLQADEYRGRYPTGKA